MIFSRKRISVFGGRDVSNEIHHKAYMLGELLSKEGYLVYCGGGEGVMEAIAKGVRKLSSTNTPAPSSFPLH